MTDHTPTTEEVRSIFATGNHALGEGGVEWFTESDAAEFDDWLADHDRKIAAEALRALGQEFHDWAAIYAGPDGAHFALVWEKRIRDRADRIEQGGQE